MRKSHYNEFVIDQRQRILRFCKELNDPEKHFCYIRQELQLLETYMNDDEKKFYLVKFLVSDALQYFNSLSSYKTDVRMLYFWKLLGNYSLDIKMEGVLSKLNNLGFFQTSIEFYTMWLEYYVAQKNSVKINEIIQLCLNNCKIENSIDYFISLIKKSFDDLSEFPVLNQLKTVPSTNSLNNEDLKRRISNLQPLSKVLEVSEEKSTTMGTSVSNSSNAKIESNQNHKSFGNSFTTNMYKNAIEVFAQTLPLNEEVSSNLLINKKNQLSSDAIEKDTTIKDFSIYCDEMTDCNEPIENKIQISKSPKSIEQKCTLNKNENIKIIDNFASKVVSEEFSVFCDEFTQNVPRKPVQNFETVIKSDCNNMSKNQVESLVSNNQLVENSKTPTTTSSPKKTINSLKHSKIPTPQLNLSKDKDSPYAKRMRQLELSFNEESLLKDSTLSENMFITPKHVEIAKSIIKNEKEIKKKQKNISSNDLMLGIDEMTVAGAHGKFAPSLATSTPRRSIAPGLNFISPNENEFVFNTENNSLVFSELQNIEKDALAPPNNGNYVSNLQRRLSLAPITGIQETDLKNNKDNQNADQNKAKLWKSSELIDALPRLSIKGAIVEENLYEKLESDNKENQNVFMLSNNINKKLKVQSKDEDSKINKKSNVVLNPWDENERRKILNLTKSHHAIVQCHYFPDQVCPNIELNKKIDLGGETFKILKLLGEGGYAKVFQVLSEEEKKFAIKYEKPSCPWEVYICDTLQRRLPKNFLPFVMDIRDAYIFSNASTIIYDYYPCGTLLDLSNFYKKEKLEMGGLIVTFFGIQLGQILEQVHAAKIIHADIKPDNIVIATPFLSDSVSVKELLSIPVIKLIDWGRSIDMFYNPDKEFIGRAGTNNFDCIEMISNRPWNYQTDFFGFVATIHVLMFNEYLVTHRQQEKIRPVKQIKRRLALRIMWLDIFEKFLNIADCKNLPLWSKILLFMEEQLKQEVKTQQIEWKKGVERLNNGIKNISA